MLFSGTLFLFPEKNFTAIIFGALCYAKAYVASMAGLYLLYPWRKSKNGLYRLILDCNTSRERESLVFFLFCWCCPLYFVHNMVEWLFDQALADAHYENTLTQRCLSSLHVHAENSRLFAMQMEVARRHEYLSVCRRCLSAWEKVCFALRSILWLLWHFVGWWLHLTLDRVFFQLYETLLDIYSCSSCGSVYYHYFND